MQELALAAREPGRSATAGRRCRAARARARSRTFRRAAVMRTGMGRGAAATVTMSAGSIHAGKPLAQLRRDRRQVAVRKAVLLVEDDDRPLAQPGQLDQRLVLAADQVVIDHEEEKVGADGQRRASISRSLSALARLPTARECRSGKRLHRRRQARTCGSHRAGLCPSPPRSRPPRGRAGR